MPVLSAAESACVKAWFGSSRAAGMPSSWTVNLYDGDPRDTGVVLPSTGGYSSLSVANTDANFPESGGVVTCTLSWPASSAAWGADGRWVVFSNGATPWVAVPLVEPIIVAQAGVVVSNVSVPLFLDSLTDVPEVE